MYVCMYVFMYVCGWVLQVLEILNDANVNIASLNVARAADNKALCFMALVCTVCMYVCVFIYVRMV